MSMYPPDAPLLVEVSPRAANYPAHTLQDRQAGLMDGRPAWLESEVVRR